MTQDIYGWHIIINDTGMPYAFCQRVANGVSITEQDVLDDFTNPDDFTLIPLIKAGTEQ